MQYPETARHGGLEGKVTFSALIGKDGRVEKVSIDKADYEVFKQAALNPFVVVITTKDYDFVGMTELPGSLPKALFINIGNITNKQLKEIFDNHFPEAIKLLSKINQQLIEITN